MHLSVLCVAVALPVDVRVKAQSELSSFGSSVIPLRSLIIVRGLILLSVSLKIVDSPIFLSFCHFISVCVCVRERKRERERERESKVGIPMLVSCCFHRIAFVEKVG